MAVDDLYEFVLPHVAEWQGGDRCILCQGNEALGQHVSEKHSGGAESRTAGQPGKIGVATRSNSSRRVTNMKLDPTAAFVLVGSKKLSFKCKRDSFSHRHVDNDIFQNRSGNLLFHRPFGVLKFPAVPAMVPMITR